MKYIESETLELKKSTSEINEAIISIVAILNKHHSGELIFGISPNGTVNGQMVSEKTLRDISQKIANLIEPKIYPQIKSINIDEKECISVKFFGEETIYYAQGKAYLRVADEDRLMSAKEIENRYLKKEQTKWDSKTTNINLTDINEENLKNYIKKANQSRRITFEYSDIKTILGKLNLITNNKLTNASKLLFSKNKPIETQLAVFAGNTKTTFLDIKQHKGNIFELLDIAENYIKEHINWRADLTGSKRIEIPEIPLRSIKEALVNSFCHRDYVAPESNKIAIYKDRIEIWNPGNFPEGYEPKDYIIKETASILRNPLIANILYLSEDIEKWGSGLRRIHDECKEKGVDVKFEILKYGFSVVFYRKSDTNQTQIGHKLKTNVDTNIDTNVDTNPLKRQAWILTHIKENNIIKSKEIQLKFQVSREIASRDINTLIEQKLILKKGAGSNVWYELNKTDKSN